VPEIKILFMDLEARFVLLELNCLKYKKTSNVHINVILKRVRVNTVAVEKQYVLRILSVCL
jgi:hypothetical protein